MTQASNETASRPAPVAPRRPHSFTTHGITVSDDYAWLKDENWQEVLRDPSMLDADIRSYLEAENAYTDSLLGHTAACKRRWSRRCAAGSRRTIPACPGRMARSPICGNSATAVSTKCSAACRATAARPRSSSTATIGGVHDYFKFGGARHSPDHRLEAWSADIKGSEYFSLRVRDWEDGKDRDDLVEQTDGNVVWSADSRSFLYVRLDDNHRPMKV